MSDFGTRLIKRLEEAANRNQQIRDKNQTAKEKLEKALPVLTRSLKGNQIVLEAIREIYGALEADGEERQSTIVELNEAKDSLEMAVNLLDQAGYDFSNIQQFSNDEIWLGDHLPTIKRVVEIVNLQKLETALDEAENERFIDFAHAVKRSGQKRENIS